MRSKFTTALQAQGVLILDGGLASELERTGPLHASLWSAGCLVECPNRIKDVHRRYLGRDRR